MFVRHAAHTIFSPPISIGFLGGFQSIRRCSPRGRGRSPPTQKYATSVESKIDFMAIQRCKFLYSVTNCSVIYSNVKFPISCFGCAFGPTNAFIYTFQQKERTCCFEVPVLPRDDVSQIIFTYLLPRITARKDINVQKQERVIVWLKHSLMNSRVLFKFSSPRKQIT